MPGPTTTTLGTSGSAPVYGTLRPMTTAALDAILAQERAALAPGKTLRITGSVTSEGARATLLRRWGPYTYLGGYAERQWGGRGWSAGVQGVYTR